MAGTGREAAETPVASSGMTWRAVLIGVLLSILLAFLMIAEHALGSGWGLTGDGFGVGPLSLLFALVCGIGFLKRVGIVRSGLSPQELLVVFSMLLMVPAVSTVGLTLLPHLVGFVYYATQENRWGSRVVPLLPEGLVIQDAGVAKGFFEGVRGGGEIPYGAWVGPLCAWAVLLGTLYFTLISLLVILRKRWIEQERLPFPLAQLPLSLAGVGERPLLKDGVFWFGFVIPALVGGSAIVNRFLPFLPAIHLYYYTRFYRDSIGLLIYAHFLVLGVSYLVSLDILSSILLFTLISYAQIYLILASGSAILSNPPHDPYAHYTHLHQEALGALVVLVGVGLYEGRHHLRDVFRKAFGSAPEVDDGDELLSYRTAVVGALTGIAFLCTWLWMTGVSAWVAPVFVGVMLVTFLGVTRILAETGVVMEAPLSPIQALLNSAGAQALGRSTAAGFFLAQPWCFPSGQHVSGSVSTVLKLSHRPRLRTRSVLFALTLALLAGGVTSAWALLHYVYTLGASGFAYSGLVIGSLNSKLITFGGIMGEPSAGQPIRLLWSGVGAAAMGVLILARQRLFWWPLHPVGFAIGTVCPSWWVNVLVAWLIKRNVLKYGGASLYGRTRPFFLGLIVGQSVITSVGSVVGMLAGRV